MSEIDIICGLPRRITKEETIERYKHLTKEAEMELPEPIGCNNQGCPYYQPSKPCPAANGCGGSILT